MLLIGDPRHGSTRLALAARTQQHNILAVDVFELLLVDIAEIFREITSIAGYCDNPMQCSSRNHQRPACRAGSITHCLDPRHIG